VPTLNELVVSVSAPALRVPVPTTVEPSEKVTVPLAADGDMVAVRVTDVPCVIELEDADSVVVVAKAGELTVIVTDPDVLETYEFDPS
jgi:hypothetical protein